jgi:hypothetical protein
MPLALVEGIPYLHPRQKLRFRYFQTWEILGGECPSPMEFTVSVTYTHGATDLRMTEDWTINFGIYRGSMLVLSDEQAINDDVLKALKETAESLTAIRKRVDPSE